MSQIEACETGGEFSFITYGKRIAICVFSPCSLILIGMLDIFTTFTLCAIIRPNGK